MKFGQNVQQNPNGAGGYETGSEAEREDQLLTLEETAERLAISMPTIRAWVWRRKIEVVRIGRCVRIREKVIRDLITHNTCPAAPSRQ
jgi:excisionase family DNA binding protein